MATWTERLAKAKRPDAVIDKITDRIEQLAPKLAELRKIQEEMEDMKQALENHANEEYEAGSEVSFIGNNVQIDFTTRQFVRKIKDVNSLMKHLGTKVFLAHVTFPLKALDTLIPKDKQKEFVSSRRIGSRACRIKLTSEEKK